MADNDPIVSTTLPGGKAMPVAQSQGAGMIPMTVMGGSGESDPVVSYGPAPASTSRGPLSEIGTGLARGALVDLPTMAGQALQYATDQGSATNTFAKGLVDSAAARGQSPGLTLNPNAHNGLTNALASGAEQVAPMFAPIAAVGGAVAAAPIEVPALVATGLGAVAGGALFGAQAGQETLDKAQAKGVSPEAAQTAARLDAASTFATQVGLGLVGGKVLGVAGNALGKAVGTEAAPLASQILDQMTGQAGIIKPFLKQTAIGAAEGVGLGATQAAASAGIQNAYGIDDTDPLQAAKDSIVPMLGLTAVMAPFGLAGRALGARAAANRTALLGSEKTDPALRTKLADQYATAVEQRGGNADAARAFSQNAQTAIDSKQPLQVDAGLFEQGAVTAPVPAAPPAVAPSLPVNQQAAINANVGVSNPLPLSPDGSPLSRKDFGALPGNDALKGQELAKAYKAYTTDPDVVARSQRAAGFGEAYNAPSGQFGNDPVTGAERELTMGEVMERQAGQPAAAPPEAPPQLPYNAPPEAVNRMIADSNGLVKQEGDVYTFPDNSASKDINDVKDFFTRQAAEQSQQPAMLQLLHNPTPPEVERMVATSDGLVSKDGDTFKFPDGSTTTDIKQVQSFFAEKAQRDAARAADPNAPKQADDILADIAAVSAANDFSTKPQARVPLQKALDTIGLDKLPDHAAQIEALQAYLRNPDIKVGPATRERLDALATKWQNEAPPRELVHGTSAGNVASILSNGFHPTADTVRNYSYSDFGPEASYFTHPEGWWLGKDAGDGRAATYDATVKAELAPDAHVVTMRSDADFGKLATRLGMKDANTLMDTFFSDGLGQHGDASEHAAINAKYAPLKAALEKHGIDGIRVSGDYKPNEDYSGTTAGGFAATDQTAIFNHDKIKFRGTDGKLVDAQKAAPDLKETTKTKLDTQRQADMAAMEERARAFAKKEGTEEPGLEGNAPKEADIHGENVPASVSTDAPAHVDTLGTNVDSVEERRARIAETQAALRAQRDAGTAAFVAPDEPRTHAQESADMVDATLAKFSERLRGGEKLSPLEQERHEDLQAFRGQLDDINSGKSSTSNEAWAQTISDEARGAAAKPYTESLRRYKTDTPEATDPNLLRGSTGKLGDTLAAVAKTSSTPEVRAYAEKLAALTPDTTLSYGPGADARVAGEYHPDQNHVSIYPGGESEQTVLHEATHAATEAQITRAEQMGTPKNQADARLKAAYNELESIRAAVAAKFPDATGLNNAHEFVAELNTNKDFQQLLKDASVGQKTLWQHVVDAVRKLLGMQTKGDYLERAMAAQEPLFEHTQAPDEAGFPLRQGTTLQRLFDKSPKDATTVTDDQYAKLGTLGDKIGAGLDMSKISHAVYKALAGWKTVQYLADRVRAIPELAHFAKGVDAYLKAHDSRKLAVAGLEDPMTAYAQKTRQMLDKLGDSDKARDMSRQMATVAGEASRGEFDFRMNYADNVKPSKQGGGGRDLPAANKAYIDDIHRQFTQLQRTNPDAAKLIEEGERLNRKLLVTKTSTVARKLLDAAAGVAANDKVRLQAEIARMAPDDAERAKLQTRVDAATGVGELANAHALGLDFMDPSLAKARNAEPTKWHDGASSTLDGRLGELFKAASALPPGTPLRSHLTELATMYGAQRNNPYFSLGRSGDYFVKVAFKNMDAATQTKLQGALKGTNKVLGNLLDGNDHAFFRVDTADQAMGLRAKLEKAGGDKIDQSKSAHGLLADKSMASATGVTPALRQLLDAVHTTVDHTGLDADSAASMRDTITRQVLSMLPETSSRSAAMQRRGIPGYDADFLGNFARRANGGAQDNANMYTQSAFSQAQKHMQDATEQLARAGSTDMQIRAQMTADEINKRYSNSQKPIDNSTVNLINSFGHTFYLAASPAYLIRTTAQPFHRALPILGARYGFVSAAREVGAATGTAMRIMVATIKQGHAQGGMRGLLDANMSFKNMGLSPKDEAFVQELHDRGILNLGQSRQLQQMAMGGTQRQQDLARMASMTAQYAEMTNRLSTGLAAFRLAEKATGAAQRGTEANTEWAIQSVDRAMDNFDPSNTARSIGKHGVAGPVTPLLTAFMNYNLQTMQQIARTVHDGMFNQDKSAEGLQRSKEAKKEFAGLMATTFMISGAMGLPFANAFAGVYNTLTNDNADPKDIRTTTQNWLSDNLGHTLGGIVAHGLPHGAGFDSSTFGLENLLPGSEFLASRRLLKDRLDDSSKQLIGPALNAGVDMLNAADRFSDGYYVKGLEAALPSGLKPYFKAAELAHNGYTDSKGNKIGIEATPWDIGLQAAGFNSAKRATQIEASQFQGAREDRQKFEHGQIEDKFYKGTANNDPDTTADAGSALVNYNTKNPTQPIRDVAGGIRDRMMMLALSQASGTGVAVNRAAFPSLLHNLAYARDPDAAMPGY